jgi:hypothetical protein
MISTPLEREKAAIFVVDRALTVLIVCLDGLDIQICFQTSGYDFRLL